MVIGEGRPFVAAIAVLNRARAGRGDSESSGLQGDLSAAVASHQFGVAALQRIKQAAGHFPGYATPRKVLLTLEPWTVAAGLMTPTLKLKRQAIEAAFARRDCRALRQAAGVDGR